MDLLRSADLFLFLQKEKTREFKIWETGLLSFVLFHNIATQVLENPQALFQCCYMCKLKSALKQIGASTV